MGYFPFFFFFLGGGGSEKLIFNIFLGYEYFVDSFWGASQNWTIFLCILGSFLKVKIQNGGYSFGLLKFQLFFGCLIFLIFFFFFFFFGGGGGGGG